jgi:putative transcriptional regulator
MGMRNLNAVAGTRTRLGIDLEQSAREILAHIQGDARLPTRRIVLPDDVDARAIRTKARMSQAQFARVFCINPRTLQEWEQGRRKPDATARAYLTVIARNPEGALKALSKATRPRSTDGIAPRAIPPSILLNNAHHVQPGRSRRLRWCGEDSSLPAPGAQLKAA